MNLLSEYLDLLNSKLRHFLDMVDLTLVQYDIIEDEDYDRLVENLEQRETLMSSIDVINKSIEGFDLSNFDYDDMVEIDEINKQIAEAKDKMIYHNSILKDNVQKKRDDCINEIKDNSVNKKVVIGYGNLDYRYESSFFDQKN